MALIKCYAISDDWWLITSACHAIKSMGTLLCVTKHRVKIQGSLCYYYYRVPELSSNAAKTKLRKAFGSHLAYFTMKQFLYFIDTVIWWTWFHIVCFTVSTFKADFHSNDYPWPVHFTVHAVTCVVMMMVTYQIEFHHHS